MTTPRTGRFDYSRLLPFIGPLALFAIWQVVVMTKMVSPILLPTPGATLTALVTGIFGGELAKDFMYTVMRTLEAFAIAALDLGFGRERFIDGDINEVQRPPVILRLVFIETEIVAGDEFGHAIVFRCLPIRVGRANVGAPQPCRVDLLHRGEVNEAKTTAKHPRTTQGYRNR